MKKLLSIILAITMLSVTALFAGCAGNTADNTELLYYVYYHDPNGAKGANANATEDTRELDRLYTLAGDDYGSSYRTQATEMCVEIIRSEQDLLEKNGLEVYYSEASNGDLIVKGTRKLLKKLEDKGYQCRLYYEIYEKEAGDLPEVDLNDLYGSYVTTKAIHFKPIGVTTLTVDENGNITEPWTFEIKNSDRIVENEVDGAVSNVFGFGNKFIVNSPEKMKELMLPAYRKYTVYTESGEINGRICVNRNGIYWIIDLWNSESYILKVEKQ